MVEPSPEYLAPYWHALGKFVHRYALLEAMMHTVLLFEAEVNDPIGQALFSGTRVRDSINFIRRLMAAKGKELSPWLERAFPKVNEITSVRDKILHYGFTVEGASATVSDAPRNIPDRTTSFRITVTELDALEHDTLSALACLNMHMIENYGFNIAEEFRDRERAQAEDAWLYKFPQPAADRKKKR
jgi:hypothetical protein